MCIRAVLIFGILLGSTPLLSAQYLLDVGTTYPKVMAIITMDPDLKVIFEDTHKRVVVSHFQWAGTYYFTPKEELFRTEISRSFKNAKEADVEYQKYIAYIDSTLRPTMRQPKEARRQRQMTLSIAGQTTAIIRMDVLKNNKATLVVCINRCAVAPKEELEPGDCY